MSCGMKPLYVNYIDDQNLLSKAGGEIRKFIIVPKGIWGLPLGMDKYLVGVDLDQLDTNAGVTVKWQWSLDGSKWLDGDTLITEKTSNGTFTGTLSNANQMTPFGRVVVEVRDTTTANQVGGMISAWGYYQYGN